MRLIFTEPMPWEGNDGVIQVLVFAHEEAKKHFDENIIKPDRPKTTSGYPDENNIGAIYKIRAIRNQRNHWDCVIRCGVSGGLVYERNVNTAHAVDVFPYAINRLAHMFSEACQEQLIKSRT